MMRPMTGMAIFERLHEITDEQPEYSTVNEEFIALDGGRSYLRQSEIIGVTWIGPRKNATLRVFFNEAPHSEFAGDDARAIMRAFGLPEECP